jgi:hypothetical protein
MRWTAWSECAAALLFVACTSDAPLPAVSDQGALAALVGRRTLTIAVDDSFPSNLLASWAKEFESLHPGISVVVLGHATGHRRPRPWTTGEDVYAEAWPSITLATCDSLEMSAPDRAKDLPNGGGQR